MQITVNKGQGIKGPDQVVEGLASVIILAGIVTAATVAHFLTFGISTIVFGCVMLASSAVWENRDKLCPAPIDDPIDPQNLLAITAQGVETIGACRSEMERTEALCSQWSAFVARAHQGAAALQGPNEALVSATDQSEDLLAAAVVLIGNPSAEEADQAALQSPNEALVPAIEAEVPAAEPAVPAPLPAPFRVERLLTKAELSVKFMDIRDRSTMVDRSHALCVLFESKNLHVKMTPYSRVQLKTPLTQDFVFSTVGDILREVERLNPAEQNELVKDDVRLMKWLSVELAKRYVKSFPSKDDSLVALFTEFCNTEQADQLEGKKVVSSRPSKKAGKPVSVVSEVLVSVKDAASKTSSAAGTASRAWQAFKRAVSK